MAVTGRREVLAGLGAGVGWGLASGLLAPAGAADAPPDRLFAGTPLAGNRVAATFRRVDLALPAVTVATAAGPRPLRSLVTRTTLLTLWAEWCVPCLVEARDLAAALPAAANDRFAMLAVLTGSSAKLDRAGAATRLARAGAAGLPLAVEANGGHAVAEALSVHPPAPPPPADLPPGARVVTSPFSLPCTLLVDARGRVRGRAQGMLPAVALRPDQLGVAHTLTEMEKQSLLGNGRTAWATPDGAALLRALGQGLLDRV